MIHMMIIILGNNFIDFNKIKHSQLEKHIFASRKKLYCVKHASLIRMRVIDEHGKELESEEVHLYPENGSCPYDVIGDTSFYQEDIVPELDLIRQEGRSPFGIKRQFAQVATQIHGAFVAYGGLIIMGAVLAYAFITGGM